MNNEIKIDIIMEIQNKILVIYFLDPLCIIYQQIKEIGSFIQTPKNWEYYGRF
jgi:hypothetical protein